MVNFMRTTYPDVKWKAVPLPTGPKGQADIIFTNGIGVNAATKFPKAAAALALYLTGCENQGEIVKTGFAYSTHPDQAEPDQDPNDKAIADGRHLADDQGGVLGTQHRQGQRRRVARRWSASSWATRRSTSR